jgi:hypothetical protein
MSAAELMPSIHALPVEEKLELFHLLRKELDPGQVEASEVAIVLKPEDQCPYTADELKRMRQEEGGRPLPEIWRSLDCK